jgi:hypothetical protein
MQMDVVGMQVHDGCEPHAAGNGTHPVVPASGSQGGSGGLPPDTLRQ